MAVTTLDHVNIRTRDPAGTAKFFCDLLDMTIKPGPLGLEDNPWVVDAMGRGVVHIQRAHGEIAARHSGALDHVAFRCEPGFGTMLERVRRLDIDHRVQHFPQIRLSQIFITEPNGVLIELNCFASPDAPA